MKILIILVATIIAALIFGRKPKRPLAANEVPEIQAQREILLLEEGHQRPKLHARSSTDSVFYVGGIARVKGDKDPVTYQILEFFEGGRVRLLRNDSRDNITRDVMVNQLRPV